MAATTSSSTVAFGDGRRDRDPPPSFDGTEENFKQHIRDLNLSQHETGIPKRKHGAEVLRHLLGSAK